MDWFLSIVRIAGASFPGASSLVQLQGEIDSRALQARVARLEDPISSLQDDVPEVSTRIYERLRQKPKSDDSTKVSFDQEFYKQYSRALAALESHGYIKGGHACDKRYVAGIRLVDPSYIMYLCAREEDSRRMESLIKTVDNCKIGEWLDGNHIADSTDLPLSVIKAVFEIYESKGYGICSGELGSAKNRGKA